MASRKPPPYRGLPVSVELNAPTLVHAPPSGPGWVHELKFDGYRMLVRIDRDEVEPRTRNSNLWTQNAPGVVHALRGLGLRGTMLDGEAVLIGPDGRCDFSGLRSVLPKGRGYSVALVVFDLLFDGGEDLRALSLLERRVAFQRLVPRGHTGHIQLSELFEGGAGLFAKACALGLEGIVSKRAGSSYRGGRVSDWVKTKSPHYRRRK